MENLKMVIFGLGHIGLPTAVLFANKGIKVLGVDTDPKKVDMINQGKTPIKEPGLEELLYKAVKSGNMTATTDGVNAVKSSNVMIIIVPTPKDDFNKSDLSAVKSVCETISKGLKNGDLVIVESTVPQKTCENVVIPLLEKSGLKIGKDFGVVYTPERAIPNNTLNEMVHNVRIIGGIDEKSADNATSIYKKIVEGKIVKVKDLVTAETIKLMENTYRDTNIALANEFAMICEKLGIDTIEAIKAANYHPRVNIHLPGPGVGGHCLSVDPCFLVQMADNLGVESNLIKTARKINDGMPLHVYELVLNVLKEVKKKVNGARIGILGVAYKGNVADVRETPAKSLIKILNENGAIVHAHDPYVDDDIIRSFGAVPVEMNDALNCDCVVIVTDHDQYKKITPEMIKNKCVVCTRPLLDPEEFKLNNVIFKGVGRF